MSDPTIPDCLKYAELRMAAEATSYSRPRRIGGRLPMRIGISTTDF